MFGAWIRVVVLVALAALIGNAHCFDKCATVACASANAAPKGCHPDEHSEDDAARCPHQHSAYAGPETGLAKVTLAATVGMLPVVAEISAVVPTEHSFVSRLGTGPPPANQSG